MERARWRTTLPVEPEEDNLIRIELNDTSLLVIEPDADWSSEERVRSYLERTGKAGSPGKTVGRREEKPAPSEAGTGAGSGTGSEAGQEAQPSPQPAETPAPGNALPRSRQISEK